jgi:uncharacterized protein involved in exopolysaccharide biosynthesis|tara:strand:- start:922 stop:1848 length:927 start_codon:yes stop_codon:yes gene_type:complete
MLFLYILKKRIKLIIVITLLSISFAIVYLFFIAQPVYLTTAKLLPTGEDNSLSNIQGLASQFGLALPFQSGSNLSFSDIYPEIVKSRQLTGIVLEKKFNTRKFGQNQLLKNILSRQYRLDKYDVDERFKRSSEILQDNIKVSKARLTSIVTLEVRGLEPEFAVDLANTIISESDKLQREFKTHQISDKRSFIEERIKDVKKDLESAQEDLKEFRERNRQVQYSPALLLEEERLTTEMDVKKEIFSTLKQQFELVKIEEVEEGATVQILDKPVAPYEKSSPKIFLSIFLSIFIGFGLSVVIAYVMDGLE